jgi:hypothetical protein
VVPFIAYRDKKVVGVFVRFFVRRFLVSNGDSISDSTRCGHQ